MKTERAILEHLASRTDLYGLPDALVWGDTDGPAAAARLHCYASPTKWLLVGELLYYDQDEWGGHDAFTRSLWAYGTGAVRQRHVFQSLTGDGDEPLFIIDTDTINPRATSLMVRGSRVSIPRDPVFLSAHAIPAIESGASLYRALCSEPKTRSMLVSEQGEIRGALGVLDDVRLLLVLDDWAAPVDPASYPESECLRSLADVMASGDPTRYRPRETPNMHWRHWPPGNA